MRPERRDLDQLRGADCNIEGPRAFGTSRHSGRPDDRSVGTVAFGACRRSSAPQSRRSRQERLHAVQSDAGRPNAKIHARSTGKRIFRPNHRRRPFRTRNGHVSKYLGITTHSFQTLDPTFKIGVTNWADVEVQFNGLQASRSFDALSGAGTESGAGFGDILLRTKINLIGNDDGPVGFAIIPYVKLPSSAPVISNGAVEGGLIAPLALRLPQDYLVTLMTEVDALKDSANHREANFVNLIGVSHPLPGIEGANATVELFSAVGSDRAAPPIYTFDLGMNFRIEKHTILDVGLNLGLNNAAPKVQIYTGISARF